MPALVREAEGHRLDLRRLDEDALRALVAARYRLARADEDRLVAYLERHAEGNPFFATELLRTLEEEALLRRDEDGWTLAALDRVVVPSLLRQVIDGRVARLGEATRKPLALAAVIGQEVPLALWAEVAELDEEAVLDVVERAVEAHLLEAERGRHARPLRPRADPGGALRGRPAAAAASLASAGRRGAHGEARSPIRTRSPTTCNRPAIRAPGSGWSRRATAPSARMPG